MQRHPNTHQLRHGFVIFTKADLLEKEKMALHCYNLQSLVFSKFHACVPRFLSPPPQMTQHWETERKIFPKTVCFLFPKENTELCFRTPIIPRIMKANHYILLIQEEELRRKQGVDPDSLICVARKEFDFKSLPKIRLKGWKVLWFLQQMRKFVIGFTGLNYFWFCGKAEA